MKRKMLAVLLFFSLSATILAGCGKETAEKTVGDKADKSVENQITDNNKDVSSDVSEKVATSGNESIDVSTSDSEPASEIKEELSPEASYYLDEWDIPSELRVTAFDKYKAADFDSSALTITADSETINFVTDEIQTWYIESDYQKIDYNGITSDDTPLSFYKKMVNLIGAPNRFTVTNETPYVNDVYMEELDAYTEGIGRVYECQWNFADGYNVFLKLYLSNLKSDNGGYYVLQNIPPVVEEMQATVPDISKIKNEIELYNYYLSMDGDAIAYICRIEGVSYFGYESEFEKTLKKIDLNESVIIYNGKEYEYDFSDDILTMIKDEQDFYFFMLISLNDFMSYSDEFASLRQAHKQAEAPDYSSIIPSTVPVFVDDDGNILDEASGYFSGKINIDDLDVSKFTFTYVDEKGKIKEWNPFTSDCGISSSEVYYDGKLLSVLDLYNLLCSLIEGPGLSGGGVENAHAMWFFSDYSHIDLNFSSGTGKAVFSLSYNTDPVWI